MTSVVGTYRLVRAVSRDANGNALPAPYGGHGMGRIVLSADGRMMAAVCDGKPGSDGGKREYGGYCGTYTFDGKQLVTHVDGAPDPSRLGTDQVRGVRFEDGLMVLQPPPRTIDGHEEHRELYWERISDV